MLPIIILAYLHFTGAGLPGASAQEVQDGTAVVDCRESSTESPCVVSLKTDGVEQVAFIDEGDVSLEFQIDGYHNIYEFPTYAEYAACDFSNAKKIADAASGGTHLVLEPFLSDTPAFPGGQSDRYYACQISGHCSGGAKVRAVYTDAAPSMDIAKGVPLENIRFTDVDAVPRPGLEDSKYHYQIHVEENTFNDANKFIGSVAVDNGTPGHVEFSVEGTFWEIRNGNEIWVRGNNWFDFESSRIGLLNVLANDTTTGYGAVSMSVIIYLTDKDEPPIVHVKESLSRFMRFPLEGGDVLANLYVTDYDGHPVFGRVTAQSDDGFEVGGGALPPYLPPDATHARTSHTEGGMGEPPPPGRRGDQVRRLFPEHPEPYVWALQVRRGRLPSEQLQSRWLRRHPPAIQQPHHLPQEPQRYVQSVEGFL